MKSKKIVVSSVADIRAIADVNARKAALKSWRDAMKRGVVKSQPLVLFKHEAGSGSRAFGPVTFLPVGTSRYMPTRLWAYGYEVKFNDGAVDLGWQTVAYAKKYAVSKRAALEMV
jgi:hypothetical protein